MQNRQSFGWVLVLLAIVAGGCTGSTRSAMSAGPAGTPQASHAEISEATPPVVQDLPVLRPAENAKTLSTTDESAIPKPDVGAEASIVAEPGAMRCKLPTEMDEALGLYGSDVWPRGEVVLTFDDGPHPTITPRVLDLLAKHDMPATFFVVGRAINRKTFKIIQRMVAEGHTLGAHSYNHDVHMSTRVEGERTIAYIQGQHAVAQILVDLSLLATSEDHFDQLYRRVFQKDPAMYLPSSSLRTERAAFEARHEQLLAEYGFGPGERVHPVLYSRPPGGTPYLGQSPSWAKDGYDEAMDRLGMVNVMWHGGSGDTDPEKRADFGFLYGNIQHHARRGGVLLIHDYIRRDALASALDFIAGDPSIRVVSIDDAIGRKYGCAAWALRDRLHRPRTAPVVAALSR